MGNAGIIKVLEPPQVVKAGLFNLVAGRKLKASRVSDLDVGDKALDKLRKSLPLSYFLRPGWVFEGHQVCVIELPVWLPALPPETHRQHQGADK